MLLTAMLFVSMDTIGKYLTQSYPVFQVTWARFFFHALWLLVFLRWRIISVVRTQRLGLQISRGFYMLAANTFFVAGVSMMPLVETHSILLLSPLLATALSVPLLGERVGLRRWSCIAAGFMGALIIIRPGLGVMQMAALFPLGAACSYALYQIATRQLSHSDPPLTTLFYTVAVGVPVTTLAMPFIWQAPDLYGWILMAGMGLLGSISHFTLIKAFSAAPVAVVAPFNYTNMIWATVFGFIIFSELPDFWTLFGAAVIISSSLYAFAREQRRQSS